MSVAIVLGTRPEILKFISVIEEIKRRSVDFVIIFTGQHYDYKMSKVFLEEFNIKPDIYLEIGSGSHGKQTGEALIRIEKNLMNERPHLTLVEGDTNSSLSGALASAKQRIPVGHVEAGCRSFDFYMPEEINRVIIDHCSEFLFAPTDTAYNNLRSEGLSSRSHVVGSTLTDVCMKIIGSFTSQDQKLMDRLGLEIDGVYAIATIHRRENIEDREKLAEIMGALCSLPLKVLFPVHPHTSRKLREFRLFRKLEDCERLILTSPLDYRDFIYLLRHARLVITDSGGIQEEASIVNTPCVTVRNRTEWPETVDAGKNLLVRAVKKQIITCAKKIILDEDFYNAMKSKECPFKSGAAAKIVEIILGTPHLR